MAANRGILARDLRVEISRESIERLSDEMTAARSRHSLLGKGG